METVADFIFLGSKITVDGDCNHKIKTLLESKAIANLDSILKSRDITLPAKVYIVKAMVFPVVIYRSESWTIKKAESQKIDVFKLWDWKRFLRVPRTARSSTLATDVKNQLTGKGPDAWKDWGQKENGAMVDEMVGWHHQLNEPEFEQTPGDSEGQRSLTCYSLLGCKELDMT